MIYVELSKHLCTIYQMFETYFFKVHKIMYYFIKFTLPTHVILNIKTTKKYENASVEINNELITTRY